jgi:hypothetical protein
VLYILILKLSCCIDDQGSKNINTDKNKQPNLSNQGKYLKNCKKASSRFLTNQLLVNKQEKDSLPVKIW